MSDLAIQHISDTAFWVAAYRAMETERSDALFQDPLAKRLTGERGARIAARMKTGGIVQWVVILRTCMIDDWIRSAIAEGADTILNLGSGLDTRPYRMELPATFRWVEVDYPHVQEFKKKELADETPRCHLERISLDLSDRPARQAFLTRIASSSKKTFVLTEGVVPYLTNEEAGFLADDLRVHTAYQMWVTDYIASARKRMKTMRKQLKNAPFQFKPANWVEFFAQHGWKAREFKYYPEEAEKRGRPFKLPWWYRILVALTPRQRLEAMRRMAGYALLVPA